MSESNTTNTVLADEELFMTDDWPSYLTWIQKFFATLSIICSYAVCRELVFDLKRSKTASDRNSQQNVPLQRSIATMLLNVSLSDILFSFAVFLGEWPAPRDTLYIHHAMGNEYTCTFQGWLRALGYLASPMFSVALNAFYLLLIRYRFTSARLQNLSRIVVIGIWVYAFVLSLVPIPLQAYNSDWDVCWIVPSPLDCVGDECTRGQIAIKLEIFYSFVHIWTCIFVALGLMGLLFMTVKSLEKKSKQYLAKVSTTAERTQEDSPRKSLSISIQKAYKRFSSRISLKNPSSTNSKSRAVAYQGILFALAFLSTHLLDMIASILWRVHKMWNLQFDIVAYLVMQPSLGILNFIIFSRNREMATREGQCLRSIFCCSCCHRRVEGETSDDLEAPEETATQPKSPKNQARISMAGDIETS